MQVETFPDPFLLLTLLFLINKKLKIKNKIDDLVIKNTQIFANLNFFIKSS